ncbi:MAG: AAA family ATPase [Betaproteobacteria bacterium]|nr:AAA family ATPase [Betaproteobacteria bacterium]
MNRHALPEFRGAASALDLLSDELGLRQTITAAEVQPRPVVWLWQGRIPAGKLSILDGDAGLGKTSIALDLAARVSSGRAMPLVEAAASGPRAVLYLSAEDDAGDTLRPRLEAAGADLAHVHIWAESALPIFPADADAVGDIVAAFNIALVVIDPAVAFFAASTDTHRDASVRQTLAPLRRVSESTGCATLLIRHLNKKEVTANALYRGAGSVAFIAAVRSGLLVAPDPDHPARRVLAVSKANLAARASSISYELQQVEVPNAGSSVRIRWIAETRHLAHDLLAPPRRGRSEDSDPCVLWLRERLGGGVAVAFRNLRDEAEARGWHERKMRRAAKDLRVSVKREPRAGGGTLWSLG